MSNRTLSSEVLLGMIEQMKREFALDALAKMPSGPYVAYYHHGVSHGMEMVKINILNKMKEEDERSKPGKGTQPAGQRRAY